MIPIDKPRNNFTKPIDRLNSAAIAVSFLELSSNELIAVYTVMASMISHKSKLRVVQMTDLMASLIPSSQTSSVSRDVTSTRMSNRKK